MITAAVINVAAVLSDDCAKSQILMETNVKRGANMSLNKSKKKHTTRVIHFSQHRKVLLFFSGRLFTKIQK